MILHFTKTNFSEFKTIINSNSSDKIKNCFLIAKFDDDEIVNRDSFVFINKQSKKETTYIRIKNWKISLLHCGKLYETDGLKREWHRVTYLVEDHNGNSIKISDSYINKKSSIPGRMIRVLIDKSVFSSIDHFDCNEKIKSLLSEISKKDKKNEDLKMQIDILNTKLLACLEAKK